MQINVIGWPCTKIQRTLMNVQAAAAEFRQRPRVQWISDIEQIAGMGAMTIPTVTVNGKIKLSGRIPSLHEVKTWIEEGLGDKAA